MASSSNQETMKYTTRDKPVERKSNRKLIYEDDFQSYAYQNGMWKTNEKPSIVERDAMRDTLAEYNIKYKIDRSDVEDDM